MGLSKQLLLLWSIWILFLSPAPAHASRPPELGAAWANTEYSFIRTEGELGGVDAAMAFRLGASSYIMFPANSSIEAGLLGEDRRKYLRLNLFALGKQPQVTRAGPADLWAPDPYVRLEFASLIWAEGGFFSYSPALEAGMSFRFSNTFALAPAVRITSAEGKILERDDTMISVILGLIEIVPYDGR